MIDIMFRLLICGFFIAHGLLHWRFDTSRSWLLANTGSGESQPVRPFATLLWVLATIGFVVTGLGVLGVPILHESWRSLAVVSAAISLVLLILAWHPWLTLGVLIDIGILATLLRANFLPETVVGS